MLLDGVADIGFVLPGTPPRGLRFVALPADPVICVAGAAHPLRSRSSVPLAALADTYLALNAWGDDAAEFLAELTRCGVGQWRWRECSDANTAIRLARHHGHVALVARSSVVDDLEAGTLVRLMLRPMPRWTVPLALAYRVSDEDDPVVVALRSAVQRTASKRRR
jgi:DNA-binding transcriptional LysR family regulator